jgi:hypothetical protein
MRELNKELKGKGFITIAGKVPYKFFSEKWYGYGKELNEFNKRDSAKV